MKRLYIPLPDAPARKQIVLNLMKQQPFHLAEQELELVCSRTEGVCACVCAYMHALDVCVCAYVCAC